MQAPAFGFGKMDAVGKQTVLAKKPEAFIDRRVVRSIGIELPDGVNLKTAFRQMRLQQHARVRTQQFARELQLRLARSDGEAGRYGVAGPSAAMPFVQKLLALAHAR